MGAFRAPLGGGKAGYACRLPPKLHSEITFLLLGGPVALRFHFNNWGKTPILKMKSSNTITGYPGSPAGTTL